MQNLNTGGDGGLVSRDKISIHLFKDEETAMPSQKDNKQIERLGAISHPALLSSHVPDWVKEKLK